MHGSLPACRTIWLLVFCAVPHLCRMLQTPRHIGFRVLEHEGVEGVSCSCGGVGVKLAATTSYNRV